MQGTQSVTYAYDTVLDLVDYCGDVRRNKQSNGTPTYHRNYSPNNIKSLVFSPDGAFVFYHVAVDGKSFRKVSLSPAYVSAIQNKEGYKSITSVLYADRICASIQEVIVCSQSTQGGVTLTSAELDFYGLISNYENIKSDLKETIKSRYKRLYSFSVYHGTIQEVFQALQGENINKEDFLISKIDTLQAKMNIELFHEEDWWKGYGLASSTYVMDMKGGDLHSHFQNVMAVLDGHIKDSELDSYKKAQAKAHKSRFDKSFESYYAIYTAIDKLYIMQQSNGIALLGNIDLSRVLKERASIVDNIFIDDKMRKYLDVKVDTSVSAGQAVLKGAETLEAVTTKMYLSLLEPLVMQSLANMPDEMLQALILRVRFDFVVPSNLLNILESRGITVNTKGNLQSSIAGLARLACILCVSPTGGKSVLKYYDTETWKEMIKYDK